MKSVQVMLIATALTMVAAPASADNDGPFGFDSGWFVELRAGTPLPANTDIDVNAPGLASGFYEEDDGYAFAGSIGKWFTDRWRGEVEFSITHAEDGKVVINGATFPHAGDVDIYGVVANALYQFGDGWIRPFAGGGLGFSVIDVDNLGAVGGAFVVDDKDTVFVANVIIGADVPLNDWLSLTGRYTLGYSTKGTFDTTAAGVDVDKDAQGHHYVSIGAKIDLN